MNRLYWLMGSQWNRDGGQPTVRCVRYVTCQVGIKGLAISQRSPKSLSSGEEASSSLPPPHYSPAAVRLHFAVVLVDNGAQSIDPNAQVRDREHYMSTFVVIIDVRDNQTAPPQGFILLNQVTVPDDVGPLSFSSPHTLSRNGLHL